MTLDEFRRKNPGCRVGLPFPGFSLLMLASCLGVVVLTARGLLGARLSQVESPYDVTGWLGALCLMISFFFGAVVITHHGLTVLGWRKKGRCAFAVGATEALLVDEKGKSVQISIAEIALLEMYIHTLTIKLNAGSGQADELASIIGDVCRPGGDRPEGRALFEALAPLVRRLAPEARIIDRKPDSLFTILRG
jgi:hypothetical protein